MPQYQLGADVGSARVRDHDRDARREQDSREDERDDDTRFGNPVGRPVDGAQPQVPERRDEAAHDRRLARDHHDHAPPAGGKSEPSGSALRLLPVPCDEGEGAEDGADPGGAELVQHEAAEEEGEEQGEQRPERTGHRE